MPKTYASAQDLGATDGPLFRQPRIDFVLAGAATLFAAVIYALTVQPTVSFWDCGEFIAASVVLGVPHPPGTPLFVLLGRIFSLLPTAADMGLRVNYLSVTSGAFAVGLAYLVTARLQRRFIYHQLSFWGREWVIFVASICGAFLFAFANTVWANAVEAEVYGITIVMFTTIIYASLVWIDRRDESTGMRLLIFGTFMAVLGLGVHMMVFLAVPGMWLLVFFLKPDYRRDWRIWISALVTMLIMVTGVEAFLWNVAFWLGLTLWWTFASRRHVRKLRGMIAIIWAVILFLLSELFLPLTMFRGGWGTFEWLGTLIVFGTSVIGGFASADEAPGRAAVRWGLCSAFAGAALVAFTLQVYLPVRAHLDPRINENDPESWTAFKGFLERKQYGRVSMVERMFKRRGTWANQLGRHPRMGFWSFFEQEWGLKSGPVDIDNPNNRAMHPPVFLLLFLMGLLGVGYLSALYWRVGVPIFVILFLATVGLVVYMNFADGTHYNPTSADQAYLEVRDRDYFFTTGFAMFGICIGLGVAAFMRIFLEPKSKLWKPVVIISSGVFLFALPAKTLMANYWLNDRSRNYIPNDYAYNMLNSCDPNGVLFTYGDNDTFPLWCLQEAYSVRTDVKVINLSLANMHWYIHQVKNTIGAPFDIPDDQIDKLMPNARDGRLQDQVVNTVMESNRWQNSVYFSMSVPDNVRVYRGASLDSNLQTVGLVAKVVQRKGSRMMDLERSRELYEDVYQFRGVADSTVHKDEATRRICDNYATGVLFLAEGYRQAGQIDSAFSVAAFASHLRPHLASPRVYMCQIAGELGRQPVLDSLARVAPDTEVPNLYYSFGVAAEIRDFPDLARNAYEAALERDSKNVESFKRLVSMLYSNKEYDTLLVLVNQWMQANPTDTVAPLMQKELLRIMSEESANPDTGEGS